MSEKTSKWAYNLLQFFIYYREMFLKLTKFITQPYFFVAFELIFTLRHIFCPPKKPQ